MYRLGVLTSSRAGTVFNSERADDAQIGADGASLSRAVANTIAEVGVGA